MNDEQMIVADVEHLQVRTTARRVNDTQARQEERQAYFVRAVLLAAHIFFESSLMYLIVLAVISYLQLLVTSGRPTGHNGPLTAALIVVFLLSW